MKPKFLIIIAIIIVAIYLPIHFYYYQFLGIDSMTEIFFFCEEGLIQKDKYCYPDISTLKSNTVLIHPITSPQQVRIAAHPHTLVIFLEKDDTVTWINEASSTVAVSEKDRKWLVDAIKPKMQKQIQFNHTGFYEYSIKTDKQEQGGGTIAIVSKDSGSLPHYTKLEIARAIVEQDIGNYPITGLGIGNAENALYVAVDSSELEKNPNAESFFMERYQIMIPFDIPIRIEFAGPAIPAGN